MEFELHILDWVVFIILSLGYYLVAIKDLPSEFGALESIEPIGIYYIFAIIYIVCMWFYDINIPNINVTFS